MSEWKMPPELPELIRELTTAKGIQLTIAQLKVTVVFLDVISGLFSMEGDNLIMPSLTRPSCVAASNHLSEAESHARQAMRHALGAIALIGKGEAS